ncbi:hypothetical protein MWU59_12165 [Flavobacteriaceae bacterium F08102]|nr:hypothetical protein [Flavobacteriaceae bacterium F08102]
MLEKLYLNAPFWVQNIMVFIKGYRIQKIRFNKVFKKEFELAIENQSKGKDEIDLIQKERLKAFVKISNKTPYWYSQFKKYNVNLEANDIREELKKLPIISKGIVKKNIDKIINKEVSGKIIPMSTSGTTGSGMSFPQTNLMVNRQWAIWWAYRSIHNIEFNTWCGWFGSKNIVTASRNKPPYWKINRPGRQVLFSAFHLNKRNAPLYYQEIKKRKLTWLHGYPSQLSLFASFVLEGNYEKLPDLRIITIGAESLYDYQKEIIEKAFGVPVRQHYGLAEGVANISEDANSKLNIDHEFCYVELIPVDKENPNLCRIIGTNFSNYAFPLIRYDTNDLAEVDFEGGEMKIKKIIGRSSTYLTLGNGQRFGPISYLFKKMTNIKEAQVYQPNLNELIFRIVKNPQFKEQDEKDLLEEINKRLKDDSIKISINYVDKIERTTAGKLNPVISDVK